jgi:cyclase
MLKKRIIATVSISDGIVVQSFGFKKKLPLGRPEAFVKNLDRWMVDEIIINDFSRSKNNQNPNFDMIKQIGSIKKNTPITYSGGISNADEAARIINYGFERIALDNLYIKNPNEIKAIAKKIGSQAIIVSIPLKIYRRKLYHYNHVDKISEQLNFGKLDSYGNYFSELMLIDYLNEGKKNSFNSKIIDEFCKKNKKLKIIPFGGISENKQVHKIIKSKQVTALCIGNFLNYIENSYQLYKEFLINKKIKNIRAASYKKNFI